ncbi:MAG: ATP synthase subunit I [Sorangiineae bacterium]|nr:ATP synthase subunit I [Sorangiineae bacterium]
MTKTTGETDGIGGALRVVGLVGALLTAGAVAVSGPPVGLGVAIGALVALANLWVLDRAVRGFLTGESRAPWAVVAVLKLVLLVGALYLVVKSGVAGVMPLIVGFGALPLGITLSQLRGAPAVGKEC